ncbi:MAG: hypothetical protein O2924_02020 [Chloroflexi bacterium]|nr:hypothetical protein [Chloroflexota bacterium]
MTRITRFTGWFAAVNAVTVAAALGLGLTGGNVTAGTRAFAAWCGIG